jgi:hypothetical protein
VLISGMNSIPGIGGVMRNLVGNFLTDVVLSMMRTVATEPSGTLKSLDDAMIGRPLSPMYCEKQRGSPFSPAVRVNIQQV